MNREPSSKFKTSEWFPPEARKEAAMYHDGARQLQDRFDTRRLADCLEDVQVHEIFSDEDRGFIKSAPMFFLATADAQGRPDCSYKGGLPGFVRIIDDRTLAFADYNGNGMFRSLGNIRLNPNVGMLFIDFEHPCRLRINGVAEIQDMDPLLAEFPGAQLIIRVRAVRIFENCSRYIHKMRLVQYSVFGPKPGDVPPVPNWKRWDEIRDVLPKSDGHLTPNLRAYVRRFVQRSGAVNWCLQTFRKLRVGVRTRVTRVRLKLGKTA